MKNGMLQKWLQVSYKNRIVHFEQTKNMKETKTTVQNGQAAVVQRLHKLWHGLPHQNRVSDL